jgi:hypothetical protein
MLLPVLSGNTEADRAVLARPPRPALLRKARFSDGRVAFFIAIVLMGVYLLNGDFVITRDSWLNLRSSELIARGRLTFEPHDVPECLTWRLRDGGREALVDVSWHGDKIRSLEADGKLVSDPGSLGYLVPTRRAGQYSNVFGIGAAVSALPAVAIVNTFFGSLEAHRFAGWQAGKVMASLYVASSAGFLYMAIRTFVGTRTALLIALSYGLATCAWSVSSQSILQHAPNQFFLTVAIWAFCNLSNNARRFGAVLGASLGAATWCRPTTAVVVVVIGVYLAFKERRAFTAYVCAGLPFAVTMLAYNLYIFGQPVAFAQAMIYESARVRTGSSSIWQTPLWLGAVGELFSPSRGLFIFSPFLLFALAGCWAIWRRPGYEVLRPITIAMFAIWLVEFGHFDWWGGWSFGYRHLVDTMPFMMLPLVLVIPQLARRRVLALVFGLALVWSLAVQALGAWTYDLAWNNRFALEVCLPDGTERYIFADAATPMNWPPEPGSRMVAVFTDIDFPKYRHRLWSWQDSQLVYYATHAREARARRRAMVELACQEPRIHEAATSASLGNAWLELGNREEAARAFSAALSKVPYEPTAVMGQGVLGASLRNPEHAISLHEEALGEHPHNSNLSVNLALLLTLSERIADARQVFANLRGRDSISAWHTFLEIRARWRRQVEPHLDLRGRELLSEIDREFLGQLVRVEHFTDLGMPAEASH